MAIVNYENLPSENTPLTGGASGNLNVMQENGTTHGSDTKLGYSQAFLNDHLVNVSNEVDEDYRVNLLETKNLFDKDNCSNITINSSGVIGPNNEYLTTNYLSTKPNTKYYFSTTQKSGQTNKQIYIAYYDINKNFLSRETYAELEHLFTTPANCYYMRAGVYITGQENYQLEKGEEKTTYEAFIQNQIVVDNEKYSDTLNVGQFDSRSRVNVIKGKNIINCNDFTSYNTTGVNVTTSKTDGLLDYINVTKSSSTSENIFISICNFTLSKKTGTYNLSGCPSGGGESTYQLYFKDETTTQDVFPRNDGTPASVSLTKGHNYTLYLRLNASAKFTDKKFYPMLLSTTEIDTSYEPYITPSIYVDNEEIYSKPVVLWQNPNHNNTFASQTITLNDNISNYDYYEIIYEEYKGNNVCFSTGKIPTNMTTRMIESTVVNYRRSITAISGSSITFGDCGYNATYNSSTLTTENERIIPYQVIGYK